MAERRNFNWNTIVLAIIAAVPPTVLAGAAYLKANETHQLVNSRMSELLEISKKQAAESATLAEKGAQAQREVEEERAKASARKRAGEKVTN